MVRVPGAYWLSRKTNSVEGVWSAIAFSFFVSLACSMAYYFSGRWQRPLAVKNQAAPAEVFATEPGEA